MFEYNGTQTGLELSKYSWPRFDLIRGERDGFISVLCRSENTTRYTQSMLEFLSSSDRAAAAPVSNINYSPPPPFPLILLVKQPRVAVTEFKAISRQPWYHQSISASGCAHDLGRSFSNLKCILILQCYLFLHIAGRILIFQSKVITFDNREQNNRFLSLRRLT